MSAPKPLPAADRVVPLLEVVDVRKTYAGHRSLVDIARRRPVPRMAAVDGVSFGLMANRTLGLVGESGSGKSTLAKAIVRLVDSDSGEIRFGGTDVLGAGREELRNLRRAMQLVYQDPSSSLNPYMPAGKAIMEAARVHDQVGPAGEEARLQELLEQVRLPKEIADRRPRALSGGQKQRVAIARALATRPEVIIADEITSALDAPVQARILNLLLEMQRETGLTMLVISHDLPLVGHIADEVAVMYLGRVVEAGPVAEVFGNPAHPYTVALLEAQPSRRRRGRSSTAVEGEIPSAFELPSGCRFRSRCPLAQEICAEIDPAPQALSATHKSWCHVLPARRKSDRADLQVPVPAVAETKSV
jgi:oligopeptide/dipeptide ABC transporter ATP-binding protein